MRAFLRAMLAAVLRSVTHRPYYKGVAAALPWTQYLKCLARPASCAGLPASRTSIFMYRGHFEAAGLIAKTRAKDGEALAVLTILGEAFAADQQAKLRSQWRRQKRTQRGAPLGDLFAAANIESAKTLLTAPQMHPGGMSAHSTTVGSTKLPAPAPPPPAINDDELDRLDTELAVATLAQISKIGCFSKHPPPPPPAVPTTAVANNMAAPNGCSEKDPALGSADAVPAENASVADRRAWLAASFAQEQKEETAQKVGEAYRLSAVHTASVRWWQQTHAPRVPSMDPTMLQNAKISTKHVTAAVAFVLQTPADTQHHVGRRVLRVAMSMKKNNYVTPFARHAAETLGTPHEAQPRWAKSSRYLHSP